MPVEVREGKKNMTFIVSHQTTSTRSTWIALTRAIRIELELPQAWKNQQILIRLRVELESANQVRTIAFSAEGKDFNLSNCKDS